MLLVELNGRLQIGRQGLYDLRAEAAPLHFSITPPTNAIVLNDKNDLLAGR
jgi:hypothetical protein